MPTSRREFLKAAASGGAVALGASTPALGGVVNERWPGNPRATPAPHPLSILILGGTSFLGPHQIRYALERGHSVTIFTRGRTQPTILKGVFRHVEHLIGDRDESLDALKGRSWDAVIDNSGRRAKWTRQSAELLKDAAESYLYTSSTGVYLPYLGMDITENTELVLKDGPEIPEGRRPTYGVMKSLSEIEARKAFGEDRAIIVRPTYIVGPGDGSNRFPYWPVRLERGGEVMVPGRMNDPVQYIDVRDLTEWMIRLIENRTAGTFNAAGPASPMGVHQFVYGVHAATSSPVTWVMVPDYDFLREHGVEAVIPWIMPVGDNVGSARINIQRAVGNGLTFRPLATTVMDVLEWWHSDAVTDDRRRDFVAGPRSLMAREADILSAWKAR